MFPQDCCKICILEIDMRYVTHKYYMYMYSKILKIVIFVYLSKFNRINHSGNDIIYYQVRIMQTFPNDFIKVA